MAAQPQDAEIETLERDGFVVLKDILPPADVETSITNHVWSSLRCVPQQTCGAQLLSPMCGRVNIGWLAQP